MTIHPYISWWMHNVRHLQYKSSSVINLHLQLLRSESIKLVVDLSRRQDLALLLEILSLAWVWCCGHTPKHLLTGELVTFSFFLCFVVLNVSSAVAASCPCLPTEPWLFFSCIFHSASELILVAYMCASTTTKIKSLTVEK